MLIDEGLYYVLITVEGYRLIHLCNKTAKQTIGQSFGNGMVYLGHTVPLFKARSDLFYN